MVDNSIQQPLLHLANQENIIVKFHPENIGIGAGLTLAIKWAIEEDYDFLWAFDQDSVAHKDCLIRLISTYKTLTKSDYLIGILAPAAFDQRSNKSVDGAIFDQYRFLAYKPLSEEQYYECDSPITSGSLIVLNAAKKISYPRADLFIDGVDLDYGLRLKQQGFHNLIVPQAIMYHNFGNPIKINFLQKERYIQKYSALRHYYICRNHTYLETRYAQGYYRLTSVLWRIKYMLSTMFWIMFYDLNLEHKYLKLWACLLGTYHGLKGKLGKTWT
nr:glycosyltransferase family 2 protein [Nostoc piscinale]